MPASREHNLFHFLWVYIIFTQKITIFNQVFSAVPTQTRPDQYYRYHKAWKIFVKIKITSLKSHNFIHDRCQMAYWKCNRRQPRTVCLYALSSSAVFTHLLTYGKWLQNTCFVFWLWAQGWTNILFIFAKNVQCVTLLISLITADNFLPSYVLLKQCCKLLCIWMSLLKHS